MSYPAYAFSTSEFSSVRLFGKSIDEEKQQKKQTKAETKNMIFKP